MKKILLSALALLIFAGSGTAQNLPSYVPANGLVGWWPFNGNANDESGNGNNAIPQGAQLSNDRFSNPNSSYSFIGQSGNGITGTYMEMPNVGINMMNEFSISIWVNEQSILGDGEAYIAFGDANSSIEIRNWSGILGFYYGNIQGIAFPFNGQNNWKMYSMTRNNNELRAYINDSLVGTLTNLSSVDITNSGNYLARHKWGPNPLETSTRFTGSLDDIAIYNRALSQTEITQLYTGQVATTANCPTFPASLTQGLVGYWPFCGNALDESGNNNHGTVNGATPTSDRFGNAGSAYGFDGVNDAISVNQLFDNPTKSINVWVKPNLIDATPRCIVNIDGPQLQNGANVIRVEKINGIDKIGLTGAASVGQSAFIEQDPLLNEWQMVSMVKNPAVTSFYFNGTLVGTVGSGTYRSNDGLNKLILGADRNMLEYWFNGMIDDLAIWNRELSQNEISQLYNQGICQTSITVTDTLLIHTGITSYNPVAYQNTLKVWPNPGNQDITLDAGNLSLMQGWKIKISNSLGQEVYPATLISQQQQVLDMSSWGGNGLYFLNLINPQGHITEVKKIVLAP